jgi:hypothetical protein
MTAASVAARSDVTVATPLLEAAMDAVQRQTDAPETEYRTSYYMLSSMLGGGQRVDMENRIDLPAPTRKRICEVLTKSA